VRRLAAGLVAAAFFVAGCGVPTDGHPRSIDPDNVPFGLLDLAPATTTTSPGPADSIEVFLVGGDRLLAVRRSVPDATSLQARLDALLMGATEQEAQLGLRTALAFSSGLVSEISGSTARIDFGEAFGVPDPEQVLAIAQIVFTATAMDGIDRVAFFVRGRPVEAPAQDGTLRSEPFMRGDFALLAPP
jgi:hypothetical protein